MTRRRQTPARTRGIPADDRFAWEGLAIFTIALTVRLIHVWQIRKAPFFGVLMGDARAYDEWAQEIARGDWLGHEVFYQAPLYPYFLGLLYALAGRDLVMIRIGQAILGSIACVWLGLAGRRFFSREVGLIAGLLLAVYAPAIFFDSLLQKSVLDVFVICLVIWIVSGLAIGQGRQRWSWLWLGLGIGVLSLTRENALVFVVVIPVWIFVRGRLADGDRAAAAGAFLLGLTLVLAPVVMRNRIVGGGLYVTTSQFGPNFYIGNNPAADGTYVPLRFGRGAPEYERQDATEVAERDAGRHLTPAEVSSYWTNRALDFITSHPGAWLSLLGRKVALLWNAAETLDTESQESYAEWSMPVRLAAHVGHFGILVPLAAFGAWATWPQRQRLWILYAMSMAYAASVVMFYVFARYRFPLVPFLVLFAAAGLASAPAFLRSRSMHSALAVAPILAVAIGANWPILSRKLMQAVSENNLGVALGEEGRLDEAADHYRRAIALQAGYAPAYNNLGTALRATGHVDEAVSAYQRALVLRPDFADAHFNLANALLDQGRPDTAADHFRRALASRPDSADVHNNLGTALAAGGRLDAAIDEFRAALRLEPQSAGTHRNLGNALASSGSRDEAIDHLRRAAQLDARDGRAHYDLASVLLESRQFSGAADEFRAALELMPSSVEAHNNLGIALASQGDLDDAIDQFQQALTLRPDFDDARRNLTSAVGLRRQMPRQTNPLEQQQ